VTGDVQESELAGFIEGLVNAEVFRFKLNRTSRYTSSASYDGEQAVHAIFFCVG